jgi:lipopolysaccharide export system protein LptA
MTSWQKHTRRGLAVFFVVFAAYVYLSLRERSEFAPPVDVTRCDPDAISETTDASSVRLRGTDSEYAITWAYRCVYPDGSMKGERPQITVTKDDGRVYVLTADEGSVAPDRVEGEVRGHVQLQTDDGLELLTSRARFTETDDVVHMPEAVTFSRGRMRGAGVGATYDHAYDVLRVLSEATVAMTDAEGTTTLDGTAGQATLDRARDWLRLDGNVHVTREGQETRATEAVAHLSSDEDVMTRLELRGEASVEGGSGRLESMAARDIDLDYGEDGTTIEHAALAVGAAIALAGRGGGSGLRLSGETLDLGLAPDGSLLAVTGVGAELTLPSDGEAPARRIRADELEASGEDGLGLTAATFRRDVEYREGTGAGADRVASARVLTLDLLDTAVEGATFEGAVVFEDGRLTAEAATLEYDPGAGRLRLHGRDGFGDPRVTDAQKRVQAREIAVAIDTQDLTATGDVRTLLQRTSGDGDGRLPGLLESGDPVSVNAARLAYSGETGRAVYEGEAALWQGDTNIRADRIVVDRRRGDLVATGQAHALIALDGEAWYGEADEIRYDEAARVVTYSREPAEPTTGGGVPAGRGAAAPGAVAHLRGGTRDLRARRIDVVLAETGNGIARLEAHTDLTIVIDDRWGTGARLTYHANDDTYDLAGTPAAPAVFCDGRRESVGGTLTFSESTDKIAVDGHTRRSSNRPCSAPAP